MVKIKNNGILLILILGFVLIYNVSKIFAQSPAWQIPSIQTQFTLNNPTHNAPFSTNIWPQSISYSYYSIPIWENAFLHGLNIRTTSGTYTLPQSNKYIWSNPWERDSFPNIYWVKQYEYPVLNIPLNMMINHSSNPYWGYMGSSYLRRPQVFVDHLSKGYGYFLKGEHESAINELKKAIGLPYNQAAKIEIYLLLGMSYEALGSEYLDEAEKYLELIADFQIYDTKVGLQLAKVYYQQGKYSKAIVEYGSVIEKEPENQDAIKGLALSYFKANDLTGALKELQKAEAMDPNDPEILFTMGVVLEEKHLFAESMEYLNRVIAIAPNSSWALQAQDHLQEIELSGGASTIEDIEEEIALLIMTAPEPEDMPDDDLIILLDDIQYQILPDDTLTRKIHKLIKILDERGKDAGEISFPYDSTYQTVNIDLARVIKPDGTIIGVQEKDFQEVIPWADFPFYSNTKVLIISMPGITVGCAMEYQVTIEDIPGSKIFDHRQVDAGFTLASKNPVKIAKIQVSVPADRELNAIIINRDPLEPEIVEDGGQKDFTWTLNDIPAMIIEPMMPPILDVSPILFVTSFDSWEAIADWWREIALEAAVPNEDIRSEVDQLTEDASTQRDKARAIFQYAASQIRYVGLEYGKGARNPRQASQVYENKYGDCKDKSILLITMLAEVGIEAYPVLISTLYSGRAWEEIPRVNAFNHVITLCVIDDEWIWMDPTVDTSAFGEIPGGIQNREALVIFDEGYSLMRVPVVAPEKNMDLEIMTIQIDEDSTAAVSSTITSTGINAIYSRNFFKGLDAIYRKQHIESIITKRATGAKLIDFTLSDLDDLNEPYKLEFSYTAPDYIEWAGNIGFIQPSFLSPNMSGITQEERIYPVFLDNTSVGESITYITIPENIQILYMPPPVNLEIPQALFISEFALEQHTITYYLRYEIKALYSPPEDYAAYKAFQEQVNRELKRKIIVEAIGN